MTAFGFKATGEERMNANQPTGTLSRPHTFSRVDIKESLAGRVGSTSDMAGTTLFLCSPASAHVTGVNISLDGGKALSVLGVSPTARL